jgi:DNA replication protein DnaC
MVYSQSDINDLKHIEQDIMNCPKCGGSDLSCDCFKKYKFLNAMITAAIPAKYRYADINNIKVQQLKSSLQQVKDYVKNLAQNKEQGKGLYLYGTTGTGKSYVACYVLEQALLNKYSAFFCTVEQYKRALFDKDEDYINEVNESDFTLIDDYGREFYDTKGFIDSQVDELLRYRYDRNKPTLITSNISVQHIEDLRIKSILSDAYIKLPFECADYRKGGR